MGNGPLIPGLREFDAPKPGPRRWLVSLIVGVAVVVIALAAVGFLSGKGPLRFLGLATSQLQPIAYRTTADARVLQLELDSQGASACNLQDVHVHAVEQPTEVTVSAQIRQPRAGSCPHTSDFGSWVDLQLANGLNGRPVVRASDGHRLPQVAQ